MKKYAHISIYFFSYFFNAAVSFAVVSLLTHKLNRADYGIVNLYSVFVTFMTPLISCGTIHTINVEFFKREKKDFAKFLSDALIIPAAGTLVFTVIMFCFTAPLTSFLRVNNYFVWLMPVVVFAIFLGEVMAAITRNQNKPGLFAFFTIGKNMIEAGLSLLFVIVLHQTWNGRVHALMIAPLLFGIIIYLVLRNWDFITSPSSRKNIVSILAVSSPLIIERLSVFVVGGSDRYFIDYFVDTSEVGLYSVGAQIATVANLTLLSMNNFFYPYIFRQIKGMEEGTGGNVKKVILVYAGVSFLAVIGVLVAAPFIFHWFISPGFQPGLFYAVLLTCAYLPWIVYQAFLPVLLYHQQNRVVMYVAVASIFCSLGLNFILVPAIGAKGAAYTLFLVNTLMAAIVLFKIRKQYLFLFQKNQPAVNGTSSN